MNLEAVYIYKDIINNEKTTSKNRDLIKLFSATFPYSLEVIRMEQMFPNSFYCVNNKQYTKKIINVTFDKKYTKWDEDKKKRVTIASKKKIRKYLYNNQNLFSDYSHSFYLQKISYNLKYIPDCIRYENYLPNDIWDHVRNTMRRPDFVSYNCKALLLLL